MSDVINLSKGQKVDLTKANPALRNILVGLGWDERTTDGVEFDLDAVALLVNEDGKCTATTDMIFYNNLKSVCESVVHNGDNRTGAGEGDDESIQIDLAAIPDNIQRVILATTIHEAEENGVNFGQVKNAFVRIVDMGEDLEDIGDDEELMRFDLGEDYSTETAMLMGELYRHNGEWKFNAIGQGYTGGLPAICTEYSLTV